MKLKLVRIVEITANLARCKKILRFFLSKDCETSDRMLPLPVLVTNVHLRPPGGGGIMVTAAVPQKSAADFRISRRSDDVFFSGMALLILATVLVGFARTYFLAGVFRAPLPSVIVHIHGAVFSSWILLLIAQISLVSAGRVDIHRRLGLVGFGLASLMIVMGILAASISLARAFAPPG